MKTRMQPVDTVWSKLPRVVRDLSRQLERNVKLEMEGRDTELDRSVLEAIKDPMTHLVRNAIDHGIEPPDVRIAKGKNPEARSPCAPTTRPAWSTSRSSTTVRGSTTPSSAPRPSSGVWSLRPRWRR